MLRQANFLNHRRESGDTIVEVLIAIAIVSLILVSGYAITSKNTQSMQDSQERIQAQHLVESQIEALRAQGKLTTQNDCFVDPTDPTNSTTGSQETGTCTAFKQSGSGATYTVKISGPNTGVYTIQATWSSIGNKTASDDSNITMYYKID